MEDKYEELKAQIEHEKSVIADKKSSGELTKSAESIEEISTPEDNSQVDIVLDEALKMGYNPDYKGPNKKTPEEFVRDGSFFRKIEAQNKKIDELIEFNKKAQEHAMAVEKAAYEKGLKDAQLAKEAAVMEGDLEKYKKLEQYEKEVQEKLKTPEPSPVPLSSDAIGFKERNTWLSGVTVEDKKMQAVARAVISYLRETEPEIPEAEAIKIIEAEVKNKFPNRFANENRTKPSMITESTSTARGSSNGKLSSRLTGEQKAYIKRAREYGSKLTDEQYAKQLELIGQLRDE